VRKLISKLKKSNNYSDTLNNQNNKINRLTSKLAEQEKLLSQYQRSEYYYCALFEKTNESYCICDSDGKILKINQNAANIFGFTPSEMINQNLIEMNQKTGKIGTSEKQIIQKILKSRNPLSEELIIKSDSGIDVMFEMKLYPHHSKEGLLQIISFKEISGNTITNGDEKKQKEFLERLIKERTANLLTTNSKLQKEIRERVHREKELTESKERYKELVEKAGVAVLVDDENANLQYFNKKLTEIFGYTYKEMKKKNFLKLIHPDDEKRVRNIHKRRFLGLESDSTYEIKAIKKDGSILYLDVHTSVIKENGHIQGSRSFIWDRTEKTLIEAAHLRSEQRYRDLYDNNRDGIVVYDLDGKIVECNPVFLEMSGYTLSEITKLTNKDITPKKWLKTDVTMVQSQTLKRGYSEIYQKEYINKNKNVFPVELRTYLMRDDNNRPEGFWAIIRDISERKKIESEINMLAHTVKSIREAVSVTDLHDNILFVNEAFIKIYGYSERELIGKNINIIRSPNNDPEIIKKILPNTIARGWIGELMNRRKNGEEFPVYLSTSVIRDDKKNPIALVGIASDLTERKIIEAQLRQSQKMDAVGKLAGGIAHDFNNILSIINGYSDLALQEIDNSHKLYKKLDQVRNAGEKASNLVKQLLAFSRKQIIETKIVNINKLIYDWNSVFIRLIGEDIETQIDLEKDIGLIKADPNQLEQVFVNLILNARDAINQRTDIASEKQIKIQTRNVNLNKKFTDKHRGSSTGHYIEISISDTGVGIPNGTKDKIFEPFFTTKEEGKGTGLGLSMVYGIVKQNNGSIYVDSKPDKGTTFRIYWPIVESEISPTVVKRAKEKIIGGNETILLVEDETDVRDVASETLQSIGYKIYEAANGIEALDYIKNNGSKISLVITDVIMPGMGGKELAENIEKIQPNLKVLFTSGYTDQKIVQRGKLNNDINFLHKPYSIYELSRKIRELIES
jgi:two-component system cell cycle sensor histidine kinase/response regulator CckA